MALTEEQIKAIDKVVKDNGLANQGMNIRDAEGNVVGNVERGTNGINTSGQVVYQKSGGGWSADPIDASKFTLEKNGNINLIAPKSLADAPEFKQTFDIDTLKTYSAAYKMDKNYRVPYMERGDDGTVTETQITIPELVEKYNEALSKYIENYRGAEKNRELIAEQYGDKAKNLSLTQISAISESSGKPDRVYLPDFIFGQDTPLKALENIRQADGTVSKDEFTEVYTRSNLDQEELAGILASLEGHLRGSDWAKEGANSVDEAARAMALKNYILSNDPDSEWWQTAGDSIVTLTANAAKGFNDIFVLNPATLVEGATNIFRKEKSTTIQDYTDEVDEAFSAWNQDRALLHDSTVTLATLGQIGGMIGGVITQGAIIGGIGKATSAKYGTLLSKGQAAREAVLSVGPSAAIALTPETFALAMADIGKISVGARFVMKTAPIAQKVAWAAGIYKTFMESHKVIDWATSLLMDTVHDAIVFDASTFRHVIESSDDENAKNYWMSQLADNSRWWIGTAIAGRSLRLAGSTPLGQLANAKTSQLINKIAADVGDKKQAIKDRIYGGDVVKHLKSQIDALPESSNKRRRLVNKLQQTELNEELRKARRAFANMDLERSGLFKLTDESLKKYHNAQDTIRQVENAIDHYNQSTIWKQMEMLGTVEDPATGNKIFVNPDLGFANAGATKVYQKLLDLTEKYKLPLANDSHLGQDIVDYIVGKHDLAIKEAIRGVDAAKATADAVVIRSNLAKIGERLPAEVKTFLDNPDTIKSYTNFYYRLNEYGKSKGIVDSDLITSYENNPIWKENGYMPVVHEVDVSGRWVPDDGRYAALIEQDTKNITYGVKPGQHYADPELVRQQRINAMAKTEVNAELMKAYRSIEDATNRIIVSGEETQRVKTYEANAKKLENAVDDYSKSISSNALILTEPKKHKRPIKNELWDEAYISEAVSTFSLSDTTNILRSKRVLTGGSSRLSDGVTPENYMDWYNAQTDPVKKYLEQVYDVKVFQLGREVETNNFDLFRKAVINGGDDFEAGLQRAYLVGDKTFASGSVLNRAMENLTNGKAAFQDGFVVETAKGYLKNIKGIEIDDFVDEVTLNIRYGIDDYVAGVMNDAGAKAAIKAIADESGNGSALAGKYIALQKLFKNGEAKEKFWEEVEKSLKNKGVQLDDVGTLKKQFERLWGDYVKSELNDTAQALRTTNPSLLNEQNIYDEVSTLAKKISGAQERLTDNVVMYLDDKGRQVYAEVDPNFASLYNYRYQMTKTEAGAMAKFNAATSKLFRYGTTTLNLKSFGNQLFRDTGNALLVGGAWDTIKHNADNMVDVFGEDIIDQIKRFDPSGYELRQVEAIAKQTGQSLEEAAVSRELARGAAVSPATTETVLYRQFMRDAYGTDTLLTNLQDRLSGIVNKFDPDELLNGKRENYLRNRVYANNLNRALSEGYNIKQARTFATFAMNNATTNFSRQLYHMQAIADSTPYFRAAINGTKSFWRMWSLDPVGISGRIMGGLILPTIYLTGASLGDPENREVYKNIPEYQKTNSLIFVVDKQVVSIPIPQEMGNIVAPVRQFVEYLHLSNENDFWELMMNDALGFSPIDLTAFTAIDMDKMIKDPTLVDRISRGTARIFSTMAPIPLKSAYMLATGTDPYSGKKLNDPSYTYWNEATGDYEVMDYNQNNFAKAIADAYGNATGNDKSVFASAAVLEKVVSGVLGSTGSETLSAITAMFQENSLRAGLSELGKSTTQQIADPFYVETYDQADAIWKRAVRELTAEKDRIINSDKYQTVYKQLAQTTDEQARKRLMAEGQNLLSEYQNKVAQTVERLNSVYGGTFDRRKFAAVVTLLNFNSDATYQSGTRASSNIASDAFYEGKNMAVATMEALGVDGTNDMSIFGYLTTDKEGNSVMKYSTPTAIMEATNIWSGASDIDVANLAAALKANELKRNEMWDGYYAAKAKSKSELKKYKADWNARVVKALAPYIQERGVDAVMNNSATRDMLDNYLFVDNPYQTKQYLKKIFEEE